MALSLSGFVASRRQQDGPRRVSFSETRLTSSRLYDSDDEDEVERLREEEEESSLSERFGEPSNTKEEGGKRKRAAAEEEKDIAQELDQEQRKKAKKVRPQLLSENLTDSNGLIKLPIEMKRIKYKPKKGKKRDAVAAAAYCQKLVNSYRSFCTELMPTMNFEDVLLKIEQLGGKKDVKTYLANMRDNVRNYHLEQLYGREKADRMLKELNDGMKQSQDECIMLESENDFPSVMDGIDNTKAVGTPLTNDSKAVKETLFTAVSQEPNSESKEEEATFEEELPRDSTSNETADPSAAEPTSMPKNQSSKVAAGMDAESDDEEAEATFDDVMQIENKAATPKYSAAARTKDRTPSMGYSKIETGVAATTRESIDKDESQLNPAGIAESMQTLKANFGEQLQAEEGTTTMTEEKKIASAEEPDAEESSPKSIPIEVGTKTKQRCPSKEPETEEGAIREEKIKDASAGEATQEASTSNVPNESEEAKSGKEDQNKRSVEKDKEKLEGGSDTETTTMTDDFRTR